MDLNLFENKEKMNENINQFIEELKKALNNNVANTEKGEQELEEYDIYERRKIFLDNKSRRGNDIAWVMDENSVCISEHGDGGPFAIQEIDLPNTAKVRRCV